MSSVVRQGAALLSPRYNSEPARMTAFVDAVTGKKDNKDGKDGKDGKDKQHAGAKGGPGAKLDDASAAAAIAEQIAKLRRPGGPEIETKRSGE